MPPRDFGDLYRLVHRGLFFKGFAEVPRLNLEPHNIGSFERMYLTKDPICIHMSFGLGTPVPPNPAKGTKTLKILGVPSFPV